MRKIIILLSLAVCLVNLNVQGQNTVASFSFDKNAADFTSNSNDGVINGAEITVDRFDNDSSAYNFDGASFIDMGSDPSLDLQDGFSISTWCKRTGSGASQTIISRGGMANGDYWLGLVQSGADYVVEVRVDGDVFTGITAVNMEWNHITITSETGTDGIRVYLNGEEYAVFTASQDLLGASNFNLRVGNTANGNTEYFNGSIDDIQIFNKALQQSEVKFLYGILPLSTEIGASSFGNALDFDGINDFIVMDPDTLSEVYNGFTIETWAKWKGDPLFPEENNVFFEIYMGDSDGGNAGGIVQFKTNGFNAGSSWHNPCKYSIDNTMLQDNEWHHFAVTVDVELGIGKYYVDGIETGSIDRSTCFLDGDCSNEVCGGSEDTDSTSKLYGLVAKTPWDASHYSASLFTIGRSQSPSSFFGQLDEMKIWNYPRSQSEIDAERNSPASGKEYGLVYYFNFDQGTASSINMDENFVKDIVENKIGELSGFSLNGSTSNWVASNFNNNINVPKITNVYPTSSIAGQIARIYCANILNDTNYNKVFFGETEAVVQSVQNGVIKVVVPEGIVGAQPIRVLNSYGSSSALNYSIISALSNLSFSWQNQTIYSQMTPNSIEYGDFDADGDADIVASSNNELVYFENTDQGLFATSFIISDGASYNELTIIDVDNDGDLDILSTENANNLVCFKNDGLGNSWSRSIIVTHVIVDPDKSNAIAIEPIDFDRDGDLDLLVYGYLPILAEEYGIKIMSNDGLGDFSFEKVIASGKDYMRPKGLIVDDFNDDGYFDICVVTESDNGVNLLIADENGDFTATRIGDAAEYAEILVSADINNDGTPDIANIGFQCCYNWWINDGNANLTNYFSVENTGSQSTSLESGDLDGDGYLDILVGFTFGGHNTTANAAWFRNKYATNEDFELLPISDEIFNVSDLRAVDLDNDGDLDIIATSTFDNRVTAILHKYSDNDFETFSVIEQVEGDTAIIDKANHTINITVINNASLYRLVPSFTVSNLAAIKIGPASQLSGINTVDFRDSVIYSIQAENGDIQDWTIYVHTLPDAPIVNSAFNITQNSAQLNWSSSSSATAYKVQWSLDNFATYDSVNVDSTFVEIPLVAGTEYVVRVKGVNDYGESEVFSNSIQFVTTPSNPVLGAVSGIETNTAVVNWSQVSGATFYQLDIANDVDFNDFVGGYESRNVSSLSEVIIGLSGGVTYWVRLRSANGYGVSLNSAAITFITKPETPLAREASAIRPTSFKANWDRVNSDYYELEISEDVNFELITISKTIINQLSEVINELEQGQSYWYRVRAGNTAGESFNSNAIFVEQPILINDLSFDEFISQSATVGTTITFNVTGGRNSFETKIRYKSVLADDWQELVLIEDNGAYQHDVSRNDLGEVGLVFEIEVTDTYKTIVSDQQNIYWSDIQESIPINSFGGGAGDWQMFSIPYQLEDDLIETVFSALGSFTYKKEWRLVRYENEKYLDFREGISRIELGKGYWFNSIEPIEINVNGTINTNKMFEMKLRQGWNQIGNPYNVDISWNSIRTSNNVTGSVNAVQVYNPSTTSFNEGDNIGPFEAGFVWANDVTTVEISLVDDHSGGRIEEDRITNREIDKEEWLFDVRLNSGGISKELASIGMHPEASELKDKYDKTLLPRFFNYLVMYTEHDDYFYPWFTNDVVPTSDEQSWLFQLESNYVSGWSRLEWDNEPLIGKQEILWLIDEESGRIIDMSKSNSYDFMLDDNYSFSIHFNNDNSKQPIPYRMNLSDPYPNPTRGSSTIDVFLPHGQEAYDVILEIFDVQGHKVGTLANGTYEAGVHSFNANFSANETAKNGVYIYRLVLNNSSIEPIYKKLILNK